MIESRQTRNKSAYGVLENELRGMILRNELSCDCAITPETELSSRYGISRNTVRKALANLEKDGLLEKIQGRGTFVVPPEKRPANAPCKMKILTSITDYRNMSETNTYDRNLISGCLEFAFHGNMEFVFTDPTELSYEKLYDDFKTGRLNGIIWDRARKEIFPVIEQLRDKGVPQVTISRSFPGIPSVFFDVDRSIEEAVEFLMSIGHRDIAFIDQRGEYPIFFNRQRTFTDILRRSGHKNPEKYLCLMKLGDKYDDFLNLLPPVTAIISSSFLLIIALYSWLERKGLRIPQDISIISLSSENSIELRRYPETSAIIDPRREIGRIAAETLKCVISGEEVPPVSTKVRGELLVRKSCSSPSLVHK